ncbi:MAG: superoxide dismutase [Myxococcota bacterium]
MAHELPRLPWANDALAPHMSAETISYHYGKHHAAYVKKLNDAIAGTAYESLDLVEIVRKSKAENNAGVFNNAAQHFNHSFFWNCLAPNAGGEPTGRVKDELVAAFGSVDVFRERFEKEAIGHFASGWGWLVRGADGKLAIESTHDADSPIAHGKKPVLTCDVWEHAYYVDHRNDRAAFLKAFWKLVNWDFVAKNLGA